MMIKLPQTNQDLLTKTLNQTPIPVPIAAREVVQRTPEEIARMQQVLDDQLVELENALRERGWVLDPEDTQEAMAVSCSPAGLPQMQMVVRIRHPSEDAIRHPYTVIVYDFGRGMNIGDRTDDERALAIVVPTRTATLREIGLLAHALKVGIEAGQVNRGG